MSTAEAVTEKPALLWNFPNVCIIMRTWCATRN